MQKMLIIISLMAITGGGVLGVSRVNRNLSLTPAGRPIDDHAITTTIVTACTAAFAGTATLIQVETHQGIVRLSGTVADKDTADQAMEIAAGTPGVQRVEGTFVFIPVDDTDVSRDPQEHGLSI